MAAPRKKKIAAVVKVQLNAGAATPAPPVGTALGPHGVNIMDFCKQYNAATESQRGAHRRGWGSRARVELHLDHRSDLLLPRSRHQLCPTHSCLG